MRWEFRPLAPGANRATACGQASPLLKPPVTPSAHRATASGKCGCDRHRHSRKQRRRVGWLLQAGIDSSPVTRKPAFSRPSPISWVASGPIGAPSGARATVTRPRRVACRSFATSRAGSGAASSGSRRALSALSATGTDEGHSVARSLRASANRVVETGRRSAASGSRRRARGTTDQQPTSWASVANCSWRRRLNASLSAHAAVTVPARALRSGSGSADSRSQYRSKVPPAPFQDSRSC